MGLESHIDRRFRAMNGFNRRLFATVTAGMMVFWLAACSGESRANAEGGDASGEHAAMDGGGEGPGGESSEEHREGGEHTEGGEAREGGEHSVSGEHSEGGEHGGEAGNDEEGEESGFHIGAAETWDVVRNGVRLVISFDSESNAFVGTVENTTEGTLCAVRVEVHLSTGTELGPTAEVDVLAGKTTSVTLPTQGEAFESFTAHPELSPCGNS
jgi:hypothetical protein